MRLTAPERIRAMTRPWRGKRYANGRPQVADPVLARLQTIAVNDACDVLADYGFEHNYAGDWTVLYPDQVLVGRAVTCRWDMMPESSASAEGCDGLACSSALAAAALQ